MSEKPGGPAVGFIAAPCVVERGSVLYRRTNELPIYYIGFDLMTIKSVILMSKECKANQWVDITKSTLLLMQSTHFWKLIMSVTPNPYSRACVI